MGRVRGFEFTSEYAEQDLNLPTRSTPGSAGYDISSAVDMVLSPGTMALIPTGIKAYMQQDEYLGLHIRSSLAVKSGLRLANGQGIIDADYYNNPDNEGHILLAVVNGGSAAVNITKGMRLAQGIFYKFLVTDQDDLVKKESRRGGIGSTGS
jgi:dUTP pyrophosphatase